MFAISILSIAIQAGFIVHVIKTGRSMLWIVAIGLLPGIGVIAYLVVEILPELFGSRAARRAGSGVRRMIDPDRDLRRASAEVEISGNVDARRRLAEELFERGQYDAAITVYEAGLKGVFEHDPTLLLGLAQAQFARKDFAAARKSLERLTEHNPDFKSPRRSSCMRDRSNRKIRSTRPSAPTRRWCRGIRGRRPACASGCCSSGAVNRRRRAASSRMYWTAHDWDPRITAGRRPGGWNSPGEKSDRIAPPISHRSFAMQMFQRIGRFALVSIAAVLLASCAGQKEPAGKLLGDIQATVIAASSEAAKYVPDELADVRTKFDALKAAYDKQDYAEVVTNAPAVLSAAQGLATAAAAKKDEILKALDEQWTGLAGALPGYLAAVQTRIDQLSKKSGRKPPAGIDLAAAKSGVDDAASLWSKAQAAFAAGNLDEAVATARQVKVRVAAAAASLKLDLGAAAP